MEDREKLMLDYLAAWNDRDPGRIASFFTEDATYEDRGAGAVLQGRSEIAEHAALVRAGSALSAARRRAARPNGRRTTPGSG